MTRLRPYAPRASLGRLLGAALAGLVLFAACDEPELSMTLRHCSPTCSLGYACVQGACLADDGTCNPPCGAGRVCQEGQCLNASTDAGHKPSAGHQVGGESWTVLAYFVADNNLEGAAIGDLHELMAVGSAPGVDLLVQIDRSDKHHEGGVGGLPDFTTAKRLRVNRGGLEELADLGELAMGTTEALADFITWGVTTHPADRYALILWDHGGGWIVFGTDDAPKPHGMSLAELSDGVRLGLEAAGLARFALIGIDACLMGTWEVAHALHPYGEYLLASQELEPGHGWDYRSLDLLRRAPATGPVDLGEELIRGFYAQAEGYRTLQEITLSLVDLTRWAELEAALAAFLAALDGQVPALANAIGRERSGALGFGRSTDPQQDYWLVDLADFIERLEGALGALSPPAQALRSAIADAVVSRASGPATTRATGLAIYFPPTEARYRKSYDHLTGLEPWRAFLKSLYQSGRIDGEGPLFAAPAHAATATWAWPEGRLLVSADVALASLPRVAQTSAWIGVVEQATGRVLSVAAVDPALDGFTVRADWTPELLVLSQGARESWAYVTERRDAGAGLVTHVVPFLFETPAGTRSHVEWKRVMTADGHVLSSLFYQAAGGATSEMVAESGAVLRPLTRVLDGGTLRWEPAGDVAFDAGEVITARNVPVPGGSRLYLELDVYDAFGRSDFAFATVTMPDTSPGAPGTFGAACGDVDVVGRCDGSLLSYCDGGLLVTWDCSADGCPCGFDDAAGYFDCLCAP